LWVTPDKVKQLAQVYFGRYQAKPAPAELKVVEPRQSQPGSVVAAAFSAMVFGGYHRPGIKHPDNVVYEIIGRLLSDGRTSRLYSLWWKHSNWLSQGLVGFQVINIRI